jgi:hypothetical protein
VRRVRVWPDEAVDLVAVSALCQPLVVSNTGAVDPLSIDLTDLGTYPTYTALAAAIAASNGGTKYWRCRRASTGT